MTIFLVIWYVPVFVFGGLAISQYYRVRRLCRVYYQNVQYQSLRLSVWLMQYDETRTRALMRIGERRAPDLDHAVARFYRYRRGTVMVMRVGLVIFVLLILRHTLG
ncbi:MAG TPA: hypothetical protein VIL85_24400 [Thermomicrobiales bacterium]